jgi:hypothetical protein
MENEGDTSDIGEVTGKMKSEQSKNATFFEMMLDHALNNVV